MIKRNPFYDKNYIQHDVLQYFTNREKAIALLDDYLNKSDNDSFKALTFYGVGGIGKTALQRKLCDRLEKYDPPVPFAQFDMESIKDQTNAYREVLLNMRFDFEQRGFKLNFPRFDLCWAVITAYEGGEPEPLVKTNPTLNNMFNFATSLLDAPVRGLTSLVESLIQQSPELEKRIRRVFKTEEVIELRKRALDGDGTLSNELISSFVQDLAEGLPERDGKTCRAVIFIDTYEALWTGREGGLSAQARLLDEWVRELVSYCIHPDVGVLPVICGKDRLLWAEDDPEWEDELDQNILGGLSFHDAQLFLSKCGIGPSPEKKGPTALQDAIIKCCNEVPHTDSAKIAFHPFYLSLCGDIVLNNRDNHGEDPSPDMFTDVPSSKVENELATRFLKSLDSRAMELWVIELSLTPRFDEECALALDDERNHHNGRSGWERLTNFSFMQIQPDGFYRFHKIMRDVITKKFEDEKGRVVHEWFGNYWKTRQETALCWFHQWILNPDNMLSEWDTRHKNSMESMNIIQARELLKLWAETPFYDHDRRFVGNEVWGRVHNMIGNALWKTPQLAIGTALSVVIEHYTAALRVYTETELFNITQNYDNLMAFENRCLIKDSKSGFSHISTSRISTYPSNRIKPNEPSFTSSQSSFKSKNAS